jgi:hypothetical protein
MWMDKDNPPRETKWRFEKLGQTKKKEILRVQRALSCEISGHVQGPASSLTIVQPVVVCHAQENELLRKLEKPESTEVTLTVDSTIIPTYLKPLPSLARTYVLTSSLTF